MAVRVEKALRLSNPHNIDLTTDLDEMRNLIRTLVNWLQEHAEPPLSKQGIHNLLNAFFK